MSGRQRRGRAAIVGLTLALWIATLAAPTAQAAVIGVANADTASVESHVTLTVPAPGVLANDTVVAGSKSATLVSDVTHGTLTLSSNGGYTYRSDSGYVGTDSFRYKIPGGILLLLDSLPATVTITVTAPPTPAPTPTPTPRPTATPTPRPTATPTPRPTATPTPRPTPTPTPIPTSTPTSAPTATPTAPPTAAPTPTPTPTPTPAPGATPRPTPTPTPRPTLLPTLPPVPSLAPLPSLLPSIAPLPTPTPLPTPSARPGPTSSPMPTSRPTASSDSGLGGGPVDPTGGDPGGGPSAPPFLATDTFTLPVPDDDGTIELDFGSVAFTGFEWAVPALVLSVPGLFLILVVAVQGAVGLAWIPVARRWVGEDDRVHRQRRRRLSPS